MNLLVLLYFLAIAPKLLWERVVKGKKHPGFLQRLGFFLPHPQGKPTLWLHAVSVGEVKSARPLFDRLRRNYPGFFFLVTTTTATGQEEAKKTLGSADAFAYLPLDLPWVVQRWVRQLRPQLFVSIESDLWPNLLAAIQQKGGKTALVSGKMSERSARRYRRLSFFAQAIFSRLDLVCVQNELQLARFSPLVPNSARLAATGNLKFDLQPQTVDSFYWKARWNLQQPAIAIACTHPNEEERILDALYPSSPYFFFLAPRHPERFAAVGRLLAQKKIPFLRWSQSQNSPEIHRGGERVVLVDTMGALPICYTLSRLAILGGSFIDRIGGHNILEPCLYGTPVFFGPHMFGQTELAARVLEAQAGAQLSPAALRGAVDRFFASPTLEEKMRGSALALFENHRGSTERTLAKIAPLLK